MVHRLEGEGARPLIAVGRLGQLGELLGDEGAEGQPATGGHDLGLAENAERNTEFMKLYFDNDEFRKAVKEAARRRAYKIITDPLREEAMERLRTEMERETGDSL